MLGRILFLLLLFSSLIDTGIAAEWRISPIKIELAPQDKSASITVFNEDTIPINFQVKAMEWTQDENGNDNYFETEDIIFFPKILTVEPKKERLIRVGFKKNNPLKEKTYRLFVEEIPSEQSNGGVAVRIALRFGIPIFIKPLKEEIKWEIKKKAVEKKFFTIEIENSGNQHFYLTHIKLTGKSKDNPERNLFSKEIKGWYILSGSKREFKEKLEECDKIDKIHFQIVTDRFTFDDMLTISKENCGN